MASNETTKLDGATEAPQIITTEDAPANTSSPQLAAVSEAAQKDVVMSDAPENQSAVRRPVMRAKALKAAAKLS
jgi:hypothetical protein